MAWMVDAITFQPPSSLQLAPRTGGPFMPPALVFSFATSGVVEIPFVCKGNAATRLPNLQTPILMA